MKSLKLLNKITQICLVCCLTLILTGQIKIVNAAGTQYYIDSDAGNDSNNGLSANSPWRTVAKVQAEENSGRFKAGDIISFRAGRSNRYEGTFAITHSGTAQSPIKITSYGSGSKPLFSTPQPSDPDHKAFWIVGNNIIIENLKIVGHPVPGSESEGVTTNTSVGVFLLNTTGSIVRNMDISGTGFGVSIDANNNTVANNHIHDNLMIEDSRDEPYNDYGAIGVLIMGNNNRVVGNKLENNKAHSYDFGTGGEAVQFFAGNNEEVTGNLIEKNFMINNGAVLEMSGGQGSSFTNNTVAYNLIRENRHLAILNVVNSIDASTVRNLNYFNNTVIETTHDTRFPYIFLTDNNVNSDIFTLKNNVFYLKNMVAVTELQNFSHSNNLYYFDNSALGFPKDSTEIISNPLFTNFDGGDYSLSSSSPGIDSGTNLGMSSDYYNNPVPKGGLPDMGAFEYNNPNQGSSLRLYRFWSGEYKGHFFTTNNVERNNVLFNDPNWEYEGIGYYVENYDQNAQACSDSSMTKVYRFWSDVQKHHFYTINEEEKNYVIEHYPDNVWRYEGVAFCASDSERGGRKPVYRFWSDLYLGHFYTINSFEKDYVINNYDDSVWRYEGIAYYGKE